MEKIYLSIKFADTREGTLGADFKMFVAKNAPQENIERSYSLYSPTFHFCFRWKDIVNLKPEIKKLKNIHGPLYVFTTCNDEGIGHCSLILADTPMQIARDIIKNPAKYQKILDFWNTTGEIIKWSPEKLWHRLNGTYFDGNSWEIRIHSFIADLNKNNSKIIHCHNIENGFFEMGFEYLREKDYSYAIRNFNRILDISPEPAAYRAKGLCYRHLGKHQVAIENYNKAIEIEPKKRFTYALRAESYKELKKYQLAINDYSKAIELEPNSRRCYNDRGFVYKKLGKYQQALDDYNKAIEIDADYKWAYFNRGQIYKDLKEHKKALMDFEKVIEIDPSFKKAYKHQADVYQEHNNWQKAKELYQKTLEIDPEYIPTYFGYIRLYQKLEQKKEQKKYFQKLKALLDKKIKKNKELSLSFYSMACAYSLCKRQKMALRYLKHALEAGYKNAKDCDLGFICHSQEYKNMVKK